MKPILEQDVATKTIVCLDLMKKGIIDQLIGEDGHFYYKLTKREKPKEETRNSQTMNIKDKGKMKFVSAENK